MNTCIKNRFLIVICIAVSLLFSGCDFSKKLQESPNDSRKMPPSSESATEQSAQTEPVADTKPTMDAKTAEPSGENTNAKYGDKDYYFDCSIFDPPIPDPETDDGYGMGASGAVGVGAGPGVYGTGSLGTAGAGRGLIEGALYANLGSAASMEEFEADNDLLNENEFSSFQPNQFNNVLNSPFSTFGADVDTASYSILRNYINHFDDVPLNQLLRSEEILNFFRYDYPAPEEGKPFSITTELVQTPWNNDTQLLLIGIQTSKLKEIPRSNLVYLVDVSGSMHGPDRLELLKQSILASLDSFNEDDRISVVTYASKNELLISGASPVKDKEKIQRAVCGMNAFGITDGERGLEMAYEEAEKYFIKGGNNRIIMGTDGDLNVGISSENELKAYVERKRKNGVFLSLMGFGWGNLKDNRMEALADNGNGSYHYIDSINEAIRVLVEDRESTLFTVAKDVKFQLDFNPSKVKGYRLIGYETRKLNTEDFKDDQKDGGEIGANQQMTVLYEIVPAGSSVEVAETKSAYQKTEIIPSEDLATLAVRYKKPDENTSQEIKHPIASQVSTQMSENIQFAAAVAEIGMILNDSKFKGTSKFESVTQLLTPLNSVKSDHYRAEFLEMVKKMPKLVEKHQNAIKEREEWERKQKERIIMINEGKIPPKPNVRMNNPNVTGAIDKRIIKKIVRQHSGEIRACYEKELIKNHSLTGRITVEWEISKEGNVALIVIKESTMKNENIEQCISNSIKLWRFPAPKDGEIAKVEYPFEFE